MKKSPDDKKLEEMLRSSVIVSGGFMGDDPRRPAEVIDTDRSVLARLGYECAQLAERMKQITDIAVKGLGNWMDVNDRLQAKTDEAKGLLTCPWPGPERFPKRVTTVRDKQSGRKMIWSDLNIHLIGRHCFFEGRGSHFRIEPSELVEMLFQ